MNIPVRHPCIIFEQKLDSLPPCAKMIEHTEMIRKTVLEETTRDSVLLALTQKALEFGHVFDHQALRLGATTESVSDSRVRYGWAFNPLCAKDKTTLDESSFVASLKPRLAAYHSGSLDAGLGILFRVMRHFSVFPFDSSKIETIDLDGFIRAMWFIEDPHTHGRHTWIRTRDMPVGFREGSVL